MAWQNLLGGLGLESTLQKILERFSNDGDEPIYVASPDGGEPLIIEGRVQTQPAGNGNVNTFVVAGITTPTAITWIPMFRENRNRRGLYIQNAHLSTSVLLISFQPRENLAIQPAGGTLTSSQVNLYLQPGDYWEPPSGVRFTGPVTYAWYSSAATGYLNGVEFN